MNKSDQPKGDSKPAPKCGGLTVAGIGPGGEEDMTYRCREAIESADLIVGYGPYVRLASGVIGDRKTYTSGMRKEVDRVFRALEEARKGKRVCLISGGDPGVYGLAGLALETATEKDFKTIGMEVVPGVTAATAAAAVLGAPLIHDFAVVSLSDLLTERETIVKRLRFAAEGDFVAVIYNPKSTKRTELFDMLPGIFLQHRKADTPVGIVHAAGRKDQSATVTTLAALPEHKDAVGMGTTLVIGNSSTFVKEGRMITPRGYKSAEGGEHDVE